MARDFKIELDNVEMINGSDDLLKDTKVTKVTITGENKLNSLNSTFENCDELTSIEGEVNLDGVSDMTEMTLNTSLDELKVTNPTEENIQANDSLNQIGNVKIGGTKYSKGGAQDVVGSLEWNAENFTYEDTILDNVYTNSSSIEDNKNITVSDTLEQKATSIEITGQTYENLVNGKATENLLDEMSMQQVEGSPTQFTPHMEQPICLEYIEGQTYQNLVEGKGEKTLISEYSSVINDFVPNTFKPPQNQLICLEYIEGETYQNLIEGKGEYKLTDTFSTTWTESNNSIENPPSMIEIPEIWGNTVQDENDLNIIQSVGDLYVDESGEPILDEDGNEQYKLDIVSRGKNIFYQILENTYPDTTIEYWGTYYASLINGVYSLRMDVSGNNTQACINILKPSFDKSYWPNPTEKTPMMIEGKTYRVSFKYNSSSDNIILRFCDYLGQGVDIANNNTLGKESGRIPSVGEGKVSFTITPDKDVYGVGFYLRYGGDWTFNLQVYDFMIEENDTETEYEPPISNKTTILMPQPLRKGGYERYSPTNSNNDFNKPLIDKLVYENGKYTIKKKVFESTIKESFKSHLANGNLWWKLLEAFPSDITDARSYTTIPDAGIFFYGKELYIRVEKSKFPTIEDANNYIPIDFVANYSYSTSSDKMTIYEETIETKILEKPSLETYSPKTYISANTEIQPSQMNITNKEVKFLPLSLQPSKSYTVQLDSVGKNNKPITVNLGGTTTTIQPTNDTSKHHRTSITTPSELTTDNLDLSGEGVIVNDVMLFEGNTSVIKQDVGYMDGIQSIGELFESRNLFDYTQSEVGLLDHTNGNISEDNSWKYTTDFIPVEPNTTYCISQTSGSVFNYKIVEYNSSKAYLKGTNWTSSKGTDINRAYNTFTTSSNTYYIQLSWQSSIFEIQLEADTFPTEFMAYDTVRYKLEIQTYDSTWDKL